MASASKGSREIVAIKERLASAKARVESASKRLAKSKATKKQMMETITEDVDDTQSQLLSSQNEAKKVAQSLKAAEKRREVVTIDSDSDDDTEEGTSKKKMKVSTEEEASEDEDMDDEENNNNQVKVMGCGSTEVNGDYIIEQNSRSSSDIFAKEGMWKGKQGAFVLSRGSWGYWYIEFCIDNDLAKMHEVLYRTMSPQISKKRREEGYNLPPENGWECIYGASPPPTLQLQNA